MAVHPKDEHDRPFLLLGEQRESPVLRAVLDRWGMVGPVGLAAPGWEEDEVDDSWVREAVGRPLANSQLYTLADQLFVEDPEVIALLRERQDELRRLRDLNKIQLDHLLTVARELMRREWQGQHVGPQLDLTLGHIRQVDQAYFDQVREVIRTYDKRIDPWERPSVQRYRLRVLERLQNCQCLLIAGGHVGVLLNRLNLSRLLRYLDVPVIAWSGGALAMGEKVVFYHQSLPQPTHDVELSRQGMNWFQSLLLFPRSAQRLNLANYLEMALLARRFANDQCLVLSRHSELEWTSGKIGRVVGVRKIQWDGSLQEWQP